MHLAWNSIDYSILKKLNIAKVFSVLIAECYIFGQLLSRHKFVHAGTTNFW